MQKSGGAAIPMQTSIKPEFLLGSEEILDGMVSKPALPIFSEEACGFLQEMSSIILKNPETRIYPDVITFAFWCRKASLRQMAESYKEESRRLGRGIVFHIPPSNVAVNFAYSMAAGLLAGNGNVLRIPTREFPQVRMILKAAKRTLEAMPEMIPYLVFLRYGHEKEINDALSAMCDIRVIWGGDRTIGEIRKSPLKPRAKEIAFADRYSIAVIDGDAYLEAEDKERIAKDFYNDTYLTDQNACTSPRLVVWMGKRQEEARETFWHVLWERVKLEGYDLQPVQAVDKLTMLCLLGAEKKAHWRKGKDNRIFRVEVEGLDGDTLRYQGNSGFFLEYVAKDLEEILPILGERCQTISYYGDMEGKLTDLVMEHRSKGVDRVVPVGRTMDFSLVWDGYDLVREMSRKMGI